MLFCCLLIFTKNNIFEKILSGITSECQAVLIQIRPYILYGLISVQTVCMQLEVKYQQTTKVATSRKILTLYLIETSFKAFSNRAEQDQAALVRAALSGSSMFAYGNMIR